MSDIVITPASGLIDFSNNSGISSAIIQLDGSGNLNISAAAGDIQLGDTSTDIFIGDGVSNVDIVFEQDGEIRGLTGKTITLGQSDSFISFAGDITGATTFSDTINALGASNPAINVDGGGPNIIRFLDNGSSTLGIDLVFRTSPNTLGFEKSVDGTQLWETDCDTGDTNFDFNVVIDGYLRLNGAVYDNNNVVGAANSILTSTGSGVVWADAGNVVGVATDSDKLDGLDSTQFLRSDASDTATGSITFQNSSVLLDSTSASVGPWQLQQATGGALQFTISGTGGAEMELSADGANYTTASLTIGGNEVWHAGNDGTGSGLDADTVDGIQGANFLRSDTNDSFSGTLTAGQNGKIAFPDNTTVPDSPTNEQHDYITFGANGSISQVSGRGGLMITSSDDALILANGDVGRNFTSSNINAAAENIGLLSDGDIFFKTGLQNGWGVDEKTFNFSNSGQAQFESLDLSSTGTSLIVDGGSTFAGVSTFNGGLIMGSAQVITHNSTQTRDKIRVWNSGNYAIGMDNSFTFGALNNDFAMTFQMLDTTNNRGWWWGDTNHSDAQGAMSLSTQGKLSVAHSLRLGYGESDTTVPGATYTLDVSDNVSIASTVSIGSTIDIIPYNDLGTLSFEGSAGQLFSITNNLTSGSIFSVNDVSGIPSIDVDADGTIQLAPFGSTEYVGVGITNPSTKLHVNGTITCDDLNSTSDINLKDNIRNIENPVSIVQNIRGVKFDWKKNQKPSLGVIAQEIEEVLPELVNETEDHKTVNYNGIIGLLIEAVKSQQEEIDELKRKLG